MLGRVTMKFGGSSGRDAGAMQQIAQIVDHALIYEVRQATVVVSAMEAVTDQLQEAAVRAARGDAAAASEIIGRLRGRHLLTAGALTAAENGPVHARLHQLFDELVQRLSHLEADGEATPRRLDAIMGFGERCSAPLVAAALEAVGLEAKPMEATSLIITDDRFQNAAPLLKPTGEAIRGALEPLLAQGVIPVVTGFIGGTAAGVPTTLGRGGSDYTAALIGAALTSDEVWIWTDVDGVMSADPRVVPDSRTLSRLSYQEVSELAYFGAKVLHPQTIRPVIEARIPLRVKNTFRPKREGTLILPEGDLNGNAIKAVTAVRGVGLVTIEGRGMLGVPGIAARAFGSVAATGTNVLLISQASSEQSVLFAVPRSDVDRVAHALRDEFAQEIEQRGIERVWVEADTAIVTVVGAGMRSRPRVAGEVFSTVGDSDVRLLAIAQGSSECSLSLVVEGNRTEDVVRALHSLALENGSIR